MHIDIKGQLSLLVALVGIIATFVVPEGRCLVGLDKCQPSDSSNVTTRATTAATATFQSPAPDATAPSPSAHTAPLSASTKSQEESGPSFHQHNHRKHYTGPVWVRITPEPGNERKRHTVHIVWGSVERKSTFMVDEPLNLLHDKTKPDSVTMDVTVTPAARVEFGEGTPPSGQNENIRKGWTQRS